MFDTATGQQIRRFDDHTQTVTGVNWIDDERVLSASADATLRVSRLDDSMVATAVETIAAQGMVFVRERRTALVWSARGELLAWSVEETPAQLWEREPPSRNVAAYFTRGKGVRPHRVDARAADLAAPGGRPEGRRARVLRRHFGLAQYFKTSAKEGTDTDLLRSRLLAAIDWSRIPEVTSGRSARRSPVLLPDANTADLSIFLQGLTWVNLAVPEPDPIDQLVWGITGQQLNRECAPVNI